MLEIQKLIPKNSRLLGMLHDETFRPSIAPNSAPVKKGGRVLFEQKGEVIDSSSLVRAPICLLSEGDTDLLRQVGNPEEGMNIIKLLTSNTPTAAVLFDSHRKIGGNPDIVWFSEDQLFAETIGRATGIEPDKILPLLQRQSEETVGLLTSLASLNGKNIIVNKWPFSDNEVMGAIKQAIDLEAQKLGMVSSKRKTLRESSAAVVASTHALFPLIVGLLVQGQLAAIQGPVHLETNPPRWENNSALSTVIRFLKLATADWNNTPHRSLLPCIVDGEPIGEFSAFNENSPQLRRDQKWKLHVWAGRDINPFPLSHNPIFGHGIGLSDNHEVLLTINDLVEAEKKQDIEKGILGTQLLAEKIDKVLNIINFWK